MVDQPEQGVLNKRTMESLISSQESAQLSIEEIREYEEGIKRLKADYAKYIAAPSIECEKLQRTICSKDETDSSEFYDYVELLLNQCVSSDDRKKLISEFFSDEQFFRLVLDAYEGLPMDRSYTPAAELYVEIFYTKLLEPIISKISGKDPEELSNLIFAAPVWLRSKLI